MIAQTPALVLNIRPWSKTSHMVTWLSPDFGKIVTAVKGACRPKSAFLGQYDLYYTCDLLFYRRERDGVHAIRECSPVQLREPLRRQWRRAMTAAYLCDLTARVSVGPQDAEPLFGLLSQTLDQLASAAHLDPLKVLLWFEMQLLLQHGVMPDLSLCEHCRGDDKLWLRFSLPSGMILCPHRTAAHPGEATVSLHRAVRELFDRLSRLPPETFWNQETLFNASKKSETGRNLLLGLSRFLGMFIAFHLDVPSAVRRVTLEMIESTTGTNPPVQLENC